MFVETLLSFVFIALFAGDVYAYLDPGTGSYIIQLLLAVIITAALTFKNFWRYIKDLWHRIVSKKRGG